MVEVTEEGFLTYKDTLFFRAGVFDYAGCEIDPEKKMRDPYTGKIGLQQNKLYKVYRPYSEISKPDFLESLNAKPLVDNHTIIGNGPGLVKPERKNCAGVLTMVKADYANKVLRGRLDVWSTTMIDKIRKGKRELSLAYGCAFVEQAGVTDDGKRYDFVQSGLRAGNHLALVDEARNGHDCRVVDCACVCDAKFKLEQPDMDWKTMSADALVAGLKDCSDECKAKAKEFLNTPTEDEKKELEKKEKEAKEAAEKKAADEKAAQDKAIKEACDKAVADAKAQFEKDKDAAVKTAVDAAAKEAVENYKKVVKLAEDCKPRFGTISLDGITTEQQLAEKVCALDNAPAFLKTVAKDAAITALKGCLAGSPTNTNKPTTVTDSAAGSKTIADFIK